MLWLKFKTAEDKREIDRLTDSLLDAWREAGVEAGVEAEKAPAAPWLHRRVLARIEAEKRRRLEEGQTWRLLFLEAKQVLPFLTMIAIAAMCLAAWYPQLTLPAKTSASRDLAGTASRYSLPNALTAGEIQPFSSDEMMASAIPVKKPRQ